MLIHTSIITLNLLHNDIMCQILLLVIRARSILIRAFTEHFFALLMKIISTNTKQTRFLQLDYIPTEAYWRLYFLYYTSTLRLQRKRFGKI